MRRLVEIRRHLANLDATRRDIFSDGMEKWSYSAPSVKKFNRTVTRPGYLIPFSSIWGLVKPKRYLVIGVFIGTTESYAIQKTGHHPELIVLCDVELSNYNPERTNLAHAYTNIAGAKYANFKNELVVVRQDSKATQSLEKLGPYDLIFVDGAHGDEMVYGDMEMCSRALAPGGIIMVHDIANLVGVGFQKWVDDHPRNDVFYYDSDKFETSLFFTGLGMVQRMP